MCDSKVGLRIENQTTSRFKVSESDLSDGGAGVGVNNSLENQFLFQQNHFTHLQKITILELIKINSACEI
jgi:hypothetical protein